MGITTIEKGIYKEPNSVWGKTFLLVMLILFTTRLLTRTTLVTYYLFFEAFWYMFIAAFTFVYALNTFLIRRKIDELCYYFVLIFLMPLQAGVGANLSEHLPVLSGIIAQRHWFGIGGVFFILYLMQTKFFTMRDLFRAMEWLGWMCLIFFMYCDIFLNPENYLQYPFVGYSDIKGGYRFRFGVDFLSFLSVYYMIKFMSERDWWALLGSALNLAYLFFMQQGRIEMCSVLGCIFLYYMFEVNWIKAIFYIFLFLLAFIALMGLLYLIIPDRVNDYYIQYLSVLQVFTGSATTADTSVDDRLEEIGILLVYLQSYPIGWVIGIGKIASSESVLTGVHNITTVPPGDIGILGSVMTYGILGTILIYMQFLIPFRSLTYIRRYKKDIFLITAKYFLLYCFMCSLAKGYLFEQPGSTAIFILVIFAFRTIEVEMDREGLPETLLAGRAF